MVRVHPCSSVVPVPPLPEWAAAAASPAARSPPGPALFSRFTFHVSRFTFHVSRFTFHVSPSRSSILHPSSQTEVPMPRPLLLTLAAILLLLPGCTAQQIERLQSDEQQAESLYAATTQATATARQSVAALSPDS